MRENVCFVLVFLLCTVNSAILKFPDTYRLDIVHYNDFHARFEETTVDLPVCTTNDTSCIGGFSRLYHEVTTLKNDRPDALVLNAGDLYQGTYWYTLLKWPIIQKFVNMLPNDAHTLGNHEFDDGIAGLVPFIAGLSAPMVVANVNLTLEPTLQELVRPSTIVERRGRKIGIIGLITPETATSSLTENVIFLDPVEATRSEAQKLTDLGVDIIIVLSHCGLPQDKEIAEKVGHNIDIIVGGHTHSLLWNGDSPSKEHISGPYPVLIENHGGHKVLVVTASAFAKYVGNLTAYFDADGELTGYEGHPVFLNRSVPEDPKISALLEPYSEDLHAQVNEPLAVVEEDLSLDPCSGVKGCALGNLVADSLMDFAKDNIPTNMTRVVYLIRAFIRSSLAKGVLTRGAVINMLPFTNKVVSITLEGRYLVEALEFTFSKHWSEKPFTGPRIPQVAGLKAVLNVTDGKAQSVLVRDLNSGVYNEIDPDETYQVITLDFLARGLSGYKMIGDNARNKKIWSADRTIFENYAKKLGSLPNINNNRVVIVN